MSLTAKSFCGEKIESEYGTISYLEWCGKEVKRINAAGGSVRVEQAHGMCAVVHN